MITHVAVGQIDSFYLIGKKQLEITVRIRNTSSQTKEFRVGIFDNQDNYVTKTPDLYWKNLAPNEEYDFYVTTASLMTPDKHYSNFANGYFRISSYTEDSDASQLDNVFYNISAGMYVRTRPVDKSILQESNEVVSESAIKQQRVEQSKEIAAKDKMAATQGSIIQNIVDDVKAGVGVGSYLVMAGLVVGGGLLLTAGLSKAKKGLNL